LRSIETKPFDWGICPLRMDMSLFHFFSKSLCYSEIWTNRFASVAVTVKYGQIVSLLQ